jgi:hypothetical protein
LTFQRPVLLSTGTLVQRPTQLLELWYQKQQNAWHLVRTLIAVSPHLLNDLT